VTVADAPVDAAVDAAALDARIQVRRGERFTLDAALTVAGGETLAIMGPSGAGKSTLLGALAGHVPLDSGHVRLGERVLSTPQRAVEAAARDTVLLGQDPRLFPHLTARDNVAFGLRARGMSRREAGRLSDRLLERVGLGDAGPHRPADLSGGQQQRVALARAVAASPRLVLLDEPLTSLDPGTAAEIRALLSELLRSVTCVVVTHDAVDAVALADRLLVLEAGQASQSGAVREVFAAPATPFVAGLAGLNYVPGTVRDGRWMGDALQLPAPGLADGDGIAVFAPAAVRTGSDAAADIAGGSAGESSRWLACVTRVEQTLGGVRVHTASRNGTHATAAAIAYELPFEEWAEQPLAPGDEVELALDSRRVRVLPR
jgi:molybdate transport system ATP-binding protein